MKKEKVLLIYASILVPVMMTCFYFISKYNEKRIGYFVPYGIYLCILLLGILSFATGRPKHIHSRPKYLPIYYIAAFIPVAATFFVAFLPTLPHMTMKLVVITAIYALINGTLEELFWRFTFNKVFEEKILLAYVVPTVIFTSWHFALTFANGMSYHGGALALVGGAGLMGVIWGLVMYRTKNIKVLVIAHVCVNFFAFSQLLYQNFFA